MQLWPDLIIASGYVAVPAGAPILIGSNGPVKEVTDQGAGHYQVVLDAPGIPGMFSAGTGAIKGATLIAQAVNNVFAAATCTAISNVAVDVYMWDATGAALDGSFCFLFVQNNDSRAPVT